MKIKLKIELKIKMKFENNIKLEKKKTSAKSTRTFDQTGGNFQHHG